MKENQEATHEKASTKTIKGSHPTKPDAAYAVDPKEVAVSDDEALAQTALNAARQTPSVRRNRVDELKKKIADGSYRVDADAVAEKIIVEHIETDFGKNQI